jgi:hypothetical protein
LAVNDAASDFDDEELVNKAMDVDWQEDWVTYGFTTNKLMVLLSHFTLKPGVVCNISNLI